MGEYPFGFNVILTADANFNFIKVATIEFDGWYENCRQVSASEFKAEKNKKLTVKVENSNGIFHFYFVPFFLSNN